MGDRAIQRKSVKKFLDLARNFHATLSVLRLDGEGSQRGGRISRGADAKPLPSVALKHRWRNRRLKRFPTGKSFTSAQLASLTSPGYIGMLPSFVGQQGQVAGSDRSLTHLPPWPTNRRSRRMTWQIAAAEYTRLGDDLKAIARG